MSPARTRSASGCAQGRKGNPFQGGNGSTSAKGANFVESVWCRPLVGYGWRPPQDFGKNLTTQARHWASTHGPSLKAIPHL
eukprot:1143245-Pelagomonas_calceolata.AAC.9